MTDEIQKTVAAVAAPETKRMAREPIYATGFSFTDANMARAKYRNGVSRDKRFDTKIKGLCVEVRPSGSGKSTFVDLICSLLKPTSGIMTMDEQSVESNFFSWRKKFGYVTQSTYLIDDTIKNNILFGETESFDVSRFQDAIKLSQLYNFVEQLPNGIETIVGERGAMLSGGQIQRIGIARAIYHKSEILIFDESTNSLDADSEQKIIDAIVSLKNKKTIIIISHKISILKICDKIYELKDKNLKLKI